MKTVLMMLVAATMACGGAAQPAPTAKPGESGGPQGDTGVPPVIDKFHSTLAPRWHADPGPKRMADTCAAIPQFQSDGEAIASAPPPAKADPAAWTAGSKELTDAVAALDSTCKSNDATAFEPAFERVHESFHKLMEVGDGHHGHGEHGKGEHGKGEHGKGEHGKH